MGLDLNSLTRWRENLNSEVQAAVADLHNIAKQTDAERLFVTLVAVLAIGPKDTMTEESHGHIPAHLETLAFHLYLLFRPGSTSEISLGQVEKALDASRAIMRHSALAAIISDSPRAQRHTDLDDLLSWLRIEAAIVRGSAYSEQTQDEIRAIQGHFESWFEARIGLGPQRAVAIVTGIRSALEIRVNLMGPEIRASEAFLLETWRKMRTNRHQQLDEHERDLLDSVSTSKDARAKGRLRYLMSSAAESLPVSREEVRLDPPVTKTEWEILCDLIGCTPEARGKMVAPIEMRSRPLFVFSDGHVVLVDLPNALDQLWAVFDRAAKTDVTFYTGEYADRRSGWLEDQTVADLKRVFPPGTVYRKLDYPDPNRPRGTAELDAAVWWPPFLFLVEDKAKQFRLEGQLGDIGRLKADVRANIADAFDQAQRAARYIQLGDQARMVERNSGRILHLKKSDIGRIYLMTVSQHHLAGIASRLAALRGLNLFRDDEYPWALSISELDIISRTCAGPEVFVHYGERRLAIQAEKINIHGDELDFFGAYLATRLRADRIWQRDGDVPNLIGLSGFQRQFDEAMEYRGGKRKEAPEIRLEVPEQIGDLLVGLRRRSDIQARWTALHLLSLSDAALEAIARSYAQLQSSSIPPKIFRRSSYLDGNVVVSLIAAEDASAGDLSARTHDLAAIEKYRRKVGVAIGIGILRSDHSSPFTYLSLLEYPWVQDPDMERRLNEEPPFLPSPGMQRPGRNAPCFCGSGHKFKTCCLPRIERVERQLRKGSPV